MSFASLPQTRTRTFKWCCRWSRLWVCWQQGVGHLLREAGLALMRLGMEEEVRHLAGERHQQHAERRAHRWGQEDGYCVIDGQKVPIQRTRLRTKDKREQRLGSYARFPRSGP